MEKSTGLNSSQAYGTSSTILQSLVEVGATVFCASIEMKILVKKILHSETSVTLWAFCIVLTS